MNDIDILDKFEILPIRYSEREVTVNFLNETKFHAVDAATCENLWWLESGNTIEAFLQIEPSPTGIYYKLYAVGEVAEKILDLQKGIQVTVRAITIYGTVPREKCTDEDIFLEHEDVSGLLIKDILNC